MKFIKSDDEEVLDVIAQRNPQMKRAVGVLKELSADERTRMLFEERERARRDMVSRLDGASNDRAITITRNAIDMSMETDTIVKLTGLSFEEVEALK